MSLYMYLPCRGLEETIEEIFFQGVQFCADYPNSANELILWIFADVHISCTLRVISESLEVHFIL